jgi:1-acyl-sn-glycerol-3-phosphate acyltransferase
MEAENIVDKKELKGLPIWACILLFIVVFFVFMLLYSALIQGNNALRIEERYIIVNHINAVRIYMLGMNYRRNTYFRNTLNLHTLSLF